ncbi:MAG TPA: (2Fe-2S)-binding protein [Actinoplanes sp.]
MDSADGALRAAAALGPYFAWERRSTTAAELPATGDLSIDDVPAADGRSGGVVPAGGDWSGGVVSAGGDWSGDDVPTPVRRSGGGWRPLTALTDPEAVAERIEAARAVLHGPVRAVASVTFLGIASRLVSPPFAALVLAGVLPVPDRLWWRPVPSGPLPIAYESAGTVPADTRTFVATAVMDTIAPVLAAFADRYRISARVMWGNVASALAGAAGVLADSRPQHADRAGMVLERALAEPPLSGMGVLAQPDPGQARRFLIRHNCCLYYRIAGGGVCADCVLMPDPVRRRAWGAALARSAAP